VFQQGKLGDRVIHKTICKTGSSGIIESLASFEEVIPIITPSGGLPKGGLPPSSPDRVL
jgi:hypothetical protein